MRTLHALLLTSLVLFTSSHLIAAPASPVTAHLIYYNLENAHVSLVLVNRTSQPVAIPDYYTPLGFGSLPIVLPPYGTFRSSADWPKPNATGVAALAVPAAVTAYTEIHDGQNDTLRLPPQLPIDPASGPMQLQDLDTHSDQKAHLFIIADHAGASFSIDYTADDVIVSHGSGTFEPDAGTILEVPATTNRAVITVTSGSVYVFAYHRRQSGRYELQSPVFPTSVPTPAQ
jgi:hypothetical protein